MQAKNLSLLILVPKRADPCHGTTQAKAVSDTKGDKSKKPREPMPDFLMGYFIRQVRGLGSLVQRVHATARIFFKCQNLHQIVEKS